MPNHVLHSMKSYNMRIVQQNMLMTSELVKVITLLDKHNIEAIPFKGPLLSHIAYGNITLRQYADLDILVDEDLLDQAVALLYQHDYLYDEKEYQHIINNKSIFHDISLTKSSVSFELHWRLFSDEFTIDLNSINLKENLMEVSMANYKFKSFKNEMLIIYLVTHGAKHNWERVEWLLDIAKIIQNHSINWQELSQLMKRTKTEKILLSTLYLCHTILDLKLPPEIIKQINKPKYLKLSKQFEELFYQDFRSLITQKVATKKISKIQYLLLDGFTNKSLFVLSLLKPTEVDFQVIQLPNSLKFLYYIIRPFNILLRWIKKI